MSFYSNTAELNEVMSRLWKAIEEHEEMANKLIASKLVVKFNYSDPPGHLILDCSDGKSFTFTTGDTNSQPVVEMSMKADLAHEFWLGRVNVPIAILSGKIISKGPTNRALALLPVIKPAFTLYPLIYQAVKTDFSS